MDFNTIARYPTENEDWVQTVLLGGVLVFFGFLLVPLFIVYGYVIRAIRESLAGETTPPVFDEWGELLVDGVQGWLIGIVYLLIPIIVAAITVGGSIMAIATGSEAGAAAGAGGIMVGFLLSAVLGLVFGYLAVIAIVNFAREDRFGAAFDFQVIKSVALDSEYAIPWLVSVGAFLVAGLIASVPVVGFILSPFASFYVATVAANLWARGFSNAMDTRSGVAQPRDRETAI